MILSAVVSQASQIDQGEKFERILGLFPHPERMNAPTPQQRAWKMSEIERATDGEVSSSWLSAFRRRKTKKPGMRMLDLISQVMDFPFELWLTEPEQWGAVLRERGGYAVNGEQESFVDEEPRTDVAVLCRKSMSLTSEQVHLLLRMAEQMQSASVAGRDGES